MVNIISTFRLALRQSLIELTAAINSPYSFFFGKRMNVYF